jgi:hypothetical protein
MKNFTCATVNKFLAIVFATAGIASYQACGPTRFFDSDTVAKTTKSDGNGDSYSGKLGYYNSSEQNNPCQRMSSSGHPFPEKQIFFMNGSYSLVRDRCQDITPVPLNSAAIQIDPMTQDLSYQGKSYAHKTDLSEFNQVPVVCPAGKTLDIVSGNLFASPLNLTSSVWMSHPEIPAKLAGSIEALPNFLVQVTDAAKLENWRRVSQSIMINPSTTYVTSFLIKAGTQSLATIAYNELPEGQFTVIVDLANAQASVFWQDGTSNPIVTSVQRYGAGVAVSVAFTSSANTNGVAGDIGVAPYRVNNNDMYVLGDSIYATAPAVYYCR